MGDRSLLTRLTLRDILRLAEIAVCSTICVWALSGCGSQASSPRQGSSASTEPGYVSEPFTHEQQLVAQGARLIVTDGCSACHLIGRNARIAPSFTGFAGRYVTLAGGRRVLVDEQFLREVLLHPSDAPISGYDPEPMLSAVRRLHLNDEPEQVAALAAFIEQIGPEDQ